MPLRKSGTVIKSGIVLAAAVGLAAVPATANAGILSSLLTPKATATPTPTPKPVATPAPTPTPAPAASASTTTTASGNVTSSAVPAATGCTQLSTTKAFQKVDGDTADYSLAPGGNFENGAAGWTLSSGAKIVLGNETLGVSSGSHALQLPLSASATSPAFCVDESNPNFRFTYKVDNAVLSGFIAYVIYRDANGTITNVQLLSSKALALAPSTWQASPKSPLSTLIPLNANAKTASVQLKITSLNPTDFALDTADAIIGQNAATQAVHDVGSAASNLVASITGALSPVTNIGVTIDSVEIDPYRRG
ncbi:MAG: hypothetical protein AAGC46_15450 [Solirubrobacteraceae bacterium]